MTVERKISSKLTIIGGFSGTESKVSDREDIEANKGSKVASEIKSLFISNGDAYTNPAVTPSKTVYSPEIYIKDINIHVRFGAYNSMYAKVVDIDNCAILRNSTNSPGISITAEGRYFPNEDISFSVKDSEVDCGVVSGTRLIERFGIDSVYTQKTSFSGNATVTIENTSINVYGASAGQNFYVFNDLKTSTIFPLVATIRGATISFEEGADYLISYTMDESACDEETSIKFTGADLYGMNVSSFDEIELITPNAYPAPSTPRIQSNFFASLPLEGNRKVIISDSPDSSSVGQAIDVYSNIRKIESSSSRQINLKLFPAYMETDSIVCDETLSPTYGDSSDPLFNCDFAPSQSSDTPIEIENISCVCHENRDACIEIPYILKPTSLSSSGGKVGVKVADWKYEASSPQNGDNLNGNISISNCREGLMLIENSAALSGFTMIEYYFTADLTELCRGTEYLVRMNLSFENVSEALIRRSWLMELIDMTLPNFPYCHHKTEISVTKNNCDSAEDIVGNNPLSIAVPVTSPFSQPSFPDGVPIGYDPRGLYYDKGTFFSLNGTYTWPIGKAAL